MIVQFGTNIGNELDISWRPALVDSKMRLEAIDRSLVGSPENGGAANPGTAEWRDHGIILIQILHFIKHYFGGRAQNDSE